MGGVKRFTRTQRPASSATVIASLIVCTYYTTALVVLRCLLFGGFISKQVRVLYYMSVFLHILPE